MTLQSLREPGLPPTDYYAPNYKIEIEKLELDPETKGDILDLKVVMDMKEMTSFELNLSNWDDQHNRSRRNVEVARPQTKRWRASKVREHGGLADRTGHC